MLLGANVAGLILTVKTIKLNFGLVVLETKEGNTKMSVSHNSEVPPKSSTGGDKKLFIGSVSWDTSLR